MSEERTHPLQKSKPQRAGHPKSSHCIKSVPATQETDVSKATKLDEAITGQSFAADNRFSAPLIKMTMGFPVGARRESSKSPEFSTSPRNSPN